LFKQYSYFSKTRTHTRAAAKTVVVVAFVRKREHLTLLIFLRLLVPSYEYTLVVVD